MSQGEIKSFTDLNAWKESHQLVITIYQSTKGFPKEEQFGLTSQIRRCAVSITSNLAEGFSRFSNKEKTQFYFISLGSTTELQNQLLIARDVGFLPKTDFDQLAEKTIVVHKLIYGLIKSTKKRIHDS